MVPPASGIYFRNSIVPLTLSSIKPNGSRRIDADKFVNMPAADQKETLRQMDQSSMSVLFSDIRSLYSLTLSSATKEKCPAALLNVSASIITTMKPVKNYKDLATNTLIFLGEHTQPAGQNDEGRNACHWSGLRVLVEGNSNGCIENAKLFETLFDAAKSLSGFGNFEIMYQSSFDKTWADSINPNDLSRLEPPGHALVKVDSSSETFLVDPGMMRFNLNDATIENPLYLNNPAFKDITHSVRGVVQQPSQRCDMFIKKISGGYQATEYNLGHVFQNDYLIGTKFFPSLEQLSGYLNGLYPAPTFEALEASQVIIHADKNGIYYKMHENNQVHEYKLFGNGETFGLQQSIDPFDNTTSNGATRNVIRDYFSTYPRPDKAIR